MNKQLLKLLLLFTISISVISFSSCKKDENSENPSNALIGTWTINKTKVKLTVDSMDLIDYLTSNFGLTNEEAQAFENMLKEDFPDSDTDTATLEFKTDNSYHYLSIDLTDKEDGTWSVNSTGKTLSLVDTEQEKTELEIQDLTTSSVVLVSLLNEDDEFDLDDDGVDETTIDFSIVLYLSK